MSWGALPARQAYSENCLLFEAEASKKIQKNGEGSGKGSGRGRELLYQASTRVELEIRSLARVLPVCPVTLSPSVPPLYRNPGGGRR